MISPAETDIFIISWVISIALISVFIVTLLYVRLSYENPNSKGNYTAILINRNRIIEMIIPLHEQKDKSFDPYSTVTKTELLRLQDQTNQEYYQTVLSMNDIPCFPVRETIFQIYPKTIPQIVIDVKKGTYSTKNQIQFI